MLHLLVGISMHYIYQVEHPRWGVLPIMDTDAPPEGVPFAGFIYMKVWGIHWLKYMKG